MSCHSFDRGAFACAGISVKEHVAAVAAEHCFGVAHYQVAFAFVTEELVKTLIIRMCHRSDLAVLNSEEIKFGENAVACLPDVSDIFIKVDGNVDAAAYPLRQEIIEGNVPDDGF